MFASTVVVALYVCECMGGSDSGSSSAASLGQVGCSVVATVVGRHFGRRCPSLLKCKHVPVCAFVHQYTWHIARWLISINKDKERLFA